MFERAVKKLEQAVAQGVCPSAALAIGTGEEVLTEACFGVHNLERNPLPVTPDTLYDMASISKVLAATMVALRFMEDGLLRLDDNMDIFFPGVLPDKRDITIRQLMTHTSGMAAHFLLSEEASTPARAAETILSHPLVCAPGEQVIYSCMGYILLGKILEKLGGAPLDQLAQKLVFAPLDMTHTGYCPQTGDVASTERNPHSGQWLSGVVHDENARFLGGVSGNAGVFSNLRDMERFARMLLSDGRLDGVQLLSPAALQAACRNYTAGLSENRGLGFKLALGSGNFMGDLVSPGAFGHTGFTGTSLLVDPERNLFVVLLTNRVHPTRDNLQLIRFPGLLHNLILSDWSRSGREAGR